MCAFDEFAKYIMEDQWKLNYTPNPATDHTTEPDSSVLKTFNQALPQSARYDLSKLSTAFVGVASMPVVVETILQAANDAINMEDVTRDTMQMAVEMSQAAKTSRGPDVYDAQMAAFTQEVPEEAQAYLEQQNGSFDWDATLANIDDDVNSGAITAEVGDQYKNDISTFS
jgi:hypothetical protein